MLSHDLMTKLRSGVPVLGLGIRYARSAEVVRMAKAANYDMVWIDMEHSAISLDAIAAMCATALDLDMQAWVRVPERDYGAIGRVLDGGATGIIVPRIETVEQARDAAMAVRFAPHGQRSQLSTLPQVGYQTLHPRDMNAQVDQATVLQVLIETARGVACADAICAVPGVDIVSVGANDLSADLGVVGQPTHPLVLDACKTVVRAARSHHKLAVVGGMGAGRDHAELLGEGMAPFIFAGIDSDLMLDALRRKVADFSAVSPLYASPAR
jgi:4-hydroxy-2-oxoheptanedioate aldolase